jgi:cytochrome c2
MIMKLLKLAMLAVGLTLAAGNMSVPAFAAGDSKAGKKVFNKCKACHQTKAGKKGIGPNLNGFLGRKAGTLENFKFSDDVKAAGAKGLVWTPETFVAYIAEPKKYLGGLLGKKKAKTKMAFNGLKKQKDRDNLLAYLMTVTK